MRTSTVKVPTPTGRAAWLGLIATAVVSFWLLDAPQLGTAGSKLALAGGAVVIGLGRMYQSELVDVPWLADVELGRSRARFRAILNAMRWTAIILGVSTLLAFVIELNYRHASLNQPVVLSLGLIGVFLVFLREALSAMLAGDWFRTPSQRPKSTP